MRRRRRARGRLLDARCSSPKRDEASKLGTRSTRSKHRWPQHRGRSRRRRWKRATSSRSTTSSSSSSARPCRATTKPPRCWSSSTGSPSTPDVSFRDLEAGAGGEARAGTGAAAPEASSRKARHRPRSRRPRWPPRPCRWGRRSGPPGSAVMPYTLTFNGDFFQIADFIKGLDSLVKTENAKVDGRRPPDHGRRLLAAPPTPNCGFPRARSDLPVTTYLTPPGPGRHRGRDADQPGAARRRRRPRRRPEARHEAAGTRAEDARA